MIVKVVIQSIYKKKTKKLAVGEEERLCAYNKILSFNNH